LVPLCKFQTSLLISSEIDCVEIVYKNGNICIAGLNRRAGYATDCPRYTGCPKKPKTIEIVLKNIEKNCLRSCFKFSRAENRAL
jgi:hypothetical protein